MKIIKVYHPLIKINDQISMIDILDYFRDYTTPTLHQEALECREKIYRYCIALQEKGKLGNFGDMFEEKITDQNEVVTLCIGWQAELIDETLEFPFPYMQRWFDLLATDTNLIEPLKIVVE